MLGEAGAGKSPLRRSIHFNLEDEPCIRCTPEIGFLRGASILMGISWMARPFPFYPSERSQPSWMWVDMNLCARPGGGPPSGYKMSPVPSLTILMMMSLCLQVSSTKSASKLSSAWFAQPSPVKPAKPTWMPSSNEQPFLSIQRNACTSDLPASMLIRRKDFHVNLWVLGRRRQRGVWDLDSLVYHGDCSVVYSCWGVGGIFRYTT